MIKQNVVPSNKKQQTIGTYNFDESQVNHVKFQKLTNHIIPYIL